MSASRLSLAIADGQITLPEAGTIAVFRPRADQDLSALPRDRLQVIQGFFPDHEAWRRRGHDTAIGAADSYAAAIVFLPRAKAEARDLIARAMAATGGGPVIVDGQKTDGVESILKACRKQGGEIGAVYAKAHGKVFTLHSGDFTAWRAPERTPVEGGFVTAPGVFSADGIDRGSAALIAALPAGLKGRICDLGAGWGYLSHQALAGHPEITECHLVEAEHEALECARANVTDARARFHWADATSFAGADGFDHVLCNPPFHTTRAADAGIGRGFIGAASRLLARHGTLWLVANRHLPYEKDLSAAFTEVSEISGDRLFKVFRAIRPLRKTN